MKVEVYHLDWDKIDSRSDDGFHLIFQPNIESIAEAWAAGLYKKVADVPVDEPFKRLNGWNLSPLDQAWEATNTVNEPWYAKFPGTPPTRSTSVGDVIVVHGVKHFVDRIGFSSFA